MPSEQNNCARINCRIADVCTAFRGNEVLVSLNIINKFYLKVQLAVSYLFCELSGGTAESKTSKLILTIESCCKGMLFLLQDQTIGKKFK